MPPVSLVTHHDHRGKATNFRQQRQPFRQRHPTMTEATTHTKFRKIGHLCASAISPAKIPAKIPARFRQDSGKIPAILLHTNRHSLAAPQSAQADFVARSAFRRGFNRPPHTSAISPATIPATHSPHGPFPPREGGRGLGLPQFRQKSGNPSGNTLAVKISGRRNTKMYSTHRHKAHSTEEPVYPAMRREISLVDALDDRRDALPDPDAHRRQTVASPTPLQLIQQRRR